MQHVQNFFPVFSNWLIQDMQSSLRCDVWFSLLQFYFSRLSAPQGQRKFRLMKQDTAAGSCWSQTPRPPETKWWGLSRDAESGACFSLRLTTLLVSLSRTLSSLSRLSEQANSSLKSLPKSLIPRGRETKVGALLVATAFARMDFIRLAWTPSICSMVLASSKLKII